MSFFGNRLSRKLILYRCLSIGLSLGVLIHTLAAATGLSIIIQKSAMVFSIIKYLGAFYLFYLAFSAIKEKKAFLDLDKKYSNEQARILPLIKKGFFMNILNPTLAKRT